MSQIIVLRGNSASGKTSLARVLKAAHPQTTFLIAQDTIKRELLLEHEGPHSLTPKLIVTLLDWALDHQLDIILEGILRTEHYRAVYTFLDSVTVPVHYFYLNLDFDIGLQRNNLKPTPFSEIQLKKWWCHNGDPLKHAEIIIPTQLSLPERLKVIQQRCYNER
ncbi:kinase [Weissella viridescens]|uniref:kinase n=1 Tax=Weissella viridescens TaxID=1629 RepID=UPI001746C408|nr:kinase [Weissella viridescens]QOD86737.1 kinase [Weissella viridescens]